MWYLLRLLRITAQRALEPQVPKSINLSSTNMQLKRTGPAVVFGDLGFEGGIHSSANALCQRRALLAQRLILR